MTTVESTHIIGGITRGAFPWWLLSRETKAKTLVLLSDEEDVLGLVDDANALLKLPPDWGLKKDIKVAGYPADDEPARQVALFEWRFGDVDILVASNDGMTLPVDTPDDLRKRTFRFKPGLTMGRSAFEEVLATGGYSRNERTEQTGEYSIRGDVIDIWPASEMGPVRITWNFDTVEAIRRIDTHTQRSEEYLTALTLHPVLAGTAAALEAYRTSDIEVVSFALEGQSDLQTEAPPSYAGHTDRLREQLVKWHEEDWRVAIFCHNVGERDRLEELLCTPLSSAPGTKPPWLPPFIIGELEHGFLLPEFRRAILANSEIFGRYRKRVRLPKFEGAGGVSSPFDIRTGDYLVHEKHGIGRYLGLQTLKVGKMSSEYLSIEYKGGDKLYVPIFEIQQVQKYAGAEGKRPALSSLDAASWERLKSKVKEDVAKLAAELIRRAAKRSIRPGTSFPPKSHLDEEFAASFVYKLTPDQTKTLQDVDDDMSSTRAMDRLVCGDVGYGKTEIAMRAALRCALAGKQVGLLCPTTILAEQHARNFSERMADYPVTIGLLSRFQDKAEQKKVIESISKGGVDIIIGTHRLLSADVHFPNLGLLIIDEEHRFGVKQKNKLLAIRDTVDVLSLTATPIPRTLASSMSGIKDLSVIETPPEGRLPISTHVGPFDEDVMVKAVQSELDRNGQVFYVHNRVKTLLARKTWLEGLMPGLRIGMAHGQMNENALEQVMYDFLHKKIDILLATTIIESGLDIPSVNTLIVEEADEMGLSQLYQLRGRVGRSKTKAYCYLFYSSSTLTTDARKRLEALREFTALGSGLRLAMRDMEIRGAGNLLGPQQHGNMAAVGIETYSRLLNEEIAKMKGEPDEGDQVGPLLELAISAYIPDDYLPSEPERVQMYKRVLSAGPEDLVKLKEEIIDRCGTLPPPAQLFFDAAAARIRARQIGIAEVHEEDESVRIAFRPNVKIPDATLQRMLAEKSSGLSFVPGSVTGVRLPMKENENGLDVLRRYLEQFFST